MVQRLLVEERFVSIIGAIAAVTTAARELMIKQRSFDVGRDEVGMCKQMMEATIRA